jgi:hypothetical protein
LFSTVPRASGPVLTFYEPGLISGGTEGVGSCFHVLLSRTSFRLFRESRVPFSCFALPDSFPAVLRASGPVFTFCAPGLIFDGTGCVASCFHILPARVLFRRYRGRRVLCSCFVLPDSFSEVPRASRPVFMFCALGLIFGGTEGVGSHFQVLCSRTRFRRCRVRWVTFSCFVLTDSFSAVPRVSFSCFVMAIKSWQVYI